MWIIADDRDQEGKLDRYNHPHCRFHVFSRTYACVTWCDFNCTWHVTASVLHQSHDTRLQQGTLLVSPHCHDVALLASSGISDHVQAGPRKRKTRRTASQHMLQQRLTHMQAR